MGYENIYSLQDLNMKNIYGLMKKEKEITFEEKNVSLQN